MKIKSALMIGLLVANLSLAAQTMPSTASAYNAPYDTLIAMGNKGVSSGLLIGASTPMLGVMIYNRAIEVDPENPLGYERKGEAYLKYKMLEDAAEAYSQCLELDPANPKCLYGNFMIAFQGSTRYDLNEVPAQMMKQITANALAFLKVAPKEMVEEREKAELLGYAFKLGIDNPGAFDKYCKMLTADETDATVVAMLEGMIPDVQATNNNQVLASILDEIAEYYFYEENFLKAKENCMKSLATGFAYSTTYFYIASITYNQDKNPMEALKILEEGLQKKGDYAKSNSLWNTIRTEEGKKAYNSGNYAAAITYLKPVVDKYPDYERGNAYLGFAYYMSKKYSDAAPYLKTLKTIANPANANIHYTNLNELLAFAQKPSTTTPAPAIKTTLVELEKIEAIFNEAGVLRDLGSYDASVAKYTEALTYFTSTNDIPMMEKCYNKLGLCHQNMQKYDVAKEYYLKSTALGAGNSSSHANLALLAFALDENYEEAEKYVSEGFKLFPEDDQLYAMQGRMKISKAYVIFDTNDYSGCIPYFQEGLAYYTDGRAYIFYGFALNKEGLTDEAIDAWNNAFYYDESLVEEFPDIYNYVQGQN